MNNEKVRQYDVGWGDVCEPAKKNIFEGDWFNVDLSDIVTELDDEPYDTEWQE